MSHSEPRLARYCTVCRRLSLMADGQTTCGEPDCRPPWEPPKSPPISREHRLTGAQSGPCIRYTEHDAPAVKDGHAHLPNGAVSYDRLGGEWHKCEKCPALILIGYDHKHARTTWFREQLKAPVLLRDAAVLNGLEWEGY